MRARWRREIDQTDLDLQRQKEYATGHAIGAHRKVPRQKCPLCKAERDAQWQKAERPDRVNDLTAQSASEKSSLAADVKVNELDGASK